MRFWSKKFVSGAIFKTLGIAVLVFALFAAGGAGAAPNADSDVASKLTGYWTNTQDDATIKYHFNSNGTFDALVDIKNILRDVLRGTYTVNGNMVTLKYNTRNLSENIFAVNFAADGKSWSSKVNNEDVIFVADTGSTDWTQEADTAKKIIGYWTTAKNNIIVKYHFAENGNFQSLFNIEGVMNKVYSGTYKVKGSAVTLNYDEINSPTFFTLEFAPDGKSWSTIVSYKNDSEVFVFTPDVTNTDWTIIK